jgi:hypothetical protein
MLVEDITVKGILILGHQVGVDDDILATSLDSDDYDQCVSETLGMIGLLQHCHKATKNVMKETLKKMLHYVCQFKYIYDCIAFEETVARALVKVDNCVPCILHLHMRFQHATRNTSARKKTIKIAGFINTMAYENEEDPGNYRVPYDPKTGKLAEVTFDDSRVKLQELHLPNILPKTLSQEPDKSEWR